MFKLLRQERVIPSQSQSVRLLCRRMHVTKITLSQANLEHRFSFFSLYYWTQLAVYVNRFLFSRAMQTCRRAAQKGPRSRGGEFPWGVNLLQWHCRIHQPLIRKHAHAGMDQHTKSSFCLPSISYNQFGRTKWFNLPSSLVSLTDRCFTSALGKRLKFIVNPLFFFSSGL